MPITVLSARFMGPTWAAHHFGTLTAGQTTTEPGCFATRSTRSTTRVTLRAVLDMDDRTVRDHRALIMKHAGSVLCRRGEWKQLADWLAERALEHD